MTLPTCDYPSADGDGHFLRKFDYYEKIMNMGFTEIHLASDIYRLSMSVDGCGEKCLIERVKDNSFQGNHMIIDYEKQVTSLLEQMQFDAACPDCGKLSLAIWGATGTCPYCGNRTHRNEIGSSDTACVLDRPSSRLRDL
jgi:hypothetical protein